MLNYLFGVVSGAGGLLVIGYLWARQDERCTASRREDFGDV